MNYNIKIKNQRKKIDNTNNEEKQMNFIISHNYNKRIRSFYCLEEGSSTQLLCISAISSRNAIRLASFSISSRIALCVFQYLNTQRSTHACSSISNFFVINLLTQASKQALANLHNKQNQ